MKKIIQSTLIIVVYTICLLSCNSEESRWKKAVSLNTVEDYKSFIKDYPNSTNVATANKAIEELELKAMVLEFNFYQDKIIKKYLNEFSVDTITGKASVFLSEFWNEYGGLRFIATTFFEEKEKCYRYYIGPSTFLKNIKSSNEGVYYPGDQLCRFVGYKFQRNNLPDKEMIKSAKDTLRSQFKSQMSNVSNDIKSFDLFYIYNDLSAYKDSFDLIVLGRLFDFKKVGFEMEVLQTLSLFNEDEGGKCDFFIPKFIEKIDPSNNSGMELPAILNIK